MITVPSSIEAFSTVFTTYYTGIYVFSFVGAVEAQGFQRVRGEVIDVCGKIPAVGDNVSLVLVLLAGDLLQYQGSGGTLYGVRIGDELG